MENDLTLSQAITAIKSRLSLDQDLGAEWLSAKALPHDWPLTLTAPSVAPKPQSGIPPAPEKATPQADRRRTSSQTIRKTLPPLLVMPMKFAAAPDKDPIAEQALQKALNCKNCRLFEERDNLVWGEGPHNASVMVVGEGPGADEDAYGRPFVGRSGRLLTDIIEKGLGIPRNEVYITNIVKCRPPYNRNPQPDEIAACMPWLEMQADIIRPKVIIAAGMTAGRSLAGSPLDSGSLLGVWQTWRSIPFMTIYHPAYLLREGRQTPQGERAYRRTWEAIKKVIALLKE